MSALRPEHVDRPTPATLRRPALAALATLGILLGSIVGVAPPAGAWADGECTDPSGVTVVIDFQELAPGGPQVRCAPGPVATGFAALEAAGISYQTTIKFPGFLCRIAGLPGNDPCQTTSPATAYWSYWIAARGGQWCYSNWGAGNRTPPPGSVEGWSFSLHKDGSTSPPPRQAVPAALPGTSPNPLAGNDCDPRGDAPKPPADPGSGGAGTPVVPASTPGAAAPGDSGGSGGSGGSNGGSPAPNQPGAPPSDLAPGSPDPAVPGATIPGVTVPGETTTSVAAIGEVPVEETTTSTTSDEDRRRLAGANEESGSVDLSSDGSSGGGSSPLGVVLALALIAALGGGAFYVRRRASRT